MNHCAESRRFVIVAKNERAAVARGQAQQLLFRFGPLILFRSADDVLQSLDPRLLFVGQQFRIADDVDEKDMRDLGSLFPGQASTGILVSTCAALLHHSFGRGSGGLWPPGKL